MVVVQVSAPPTKRRMVPVRAGQVDELAPFAHQGGTGYLPRQHQVPDVIRPVPVVVVDLAEQLTARRLNRHLQHLAQGQRGVGLYHLDVSRKIWSPCRCRSVEPDHHLELGVALALELADGVLDLLGSVGRQQHRDRWRRRRSTTSGDEMTEPRRRPVLDQCRAAQVDHPPLPGGGVVPSIGVDRGQHFHQSIADQGCQLGVESIYHQWSGGRSHPGEVHRAGPDRVVQPGVVEDDPSRPQRLRPPRRMRRKVEGRCPRCRRPGEFDG